MESAEWNKEEGNSSRIAQSKKIVFALSPLCLYHDISWLGSQH